MDKEGFKICRAVMEDAEAIWRIRNSPEARSRSNNQEVISLDKHLEWFRNKYFSGKDSLCLVLKDGLADKVIGYCRLDLGEGGRLISIAVDTDCQGRGLGGFLLSGSLEVFRDFGGKIFAEIHKDNAPSIKIFLKNGFIKYKEDDGNYYLELNFNE